MFQNLNSLWILIDVHHLIPFETWEHKLPDFLSMKTQKSSCHSSD